MPKQFIELTGLVGASIEGKFTVNVDAIRYARPVHETDRQHGGYASGKTTTTAGCLVFIYMTEPVAVLEDYPIVQSMLGLD